MQSRVAGVSEVVDVLEEKLEVGTAVVRGTEVENVASAVVLDIDVMGHGLDRVSILQDALQYAT